MLPFKAVSCAMIPREEEDPEFMHVCEELPVLQPSWQHHS